MTVRNRELAGDYIRRAAVRLRAIEVLFQAESWPDVVRESQEVVELALKAVLLAAGVEPPRIHDVSEILAAERDRLPAAVRSELDRLTSISRDLRRDRELAFYGAADLTPSSFYTRQDAVRALEGARLVVRTVQPALAAG